MFMGIGVGIGFAQLSLDGLIAGIFSGGNQGAWYSVSRAISTPWYQDSVATTPVTAVEQSIGSARDRSGNSNHAAQPSAASRPIYKKDASGCSSIALDGVDDSLSSATGGGGTAGFFFCCAVKPANTAAGQYHLWSDQNGASGYVVVRDAARFIFYAASGTAFTPTPASSDVAAGAIALITAWDDGVNLNLQINSGPVTQIARPIVAAGTAGFSMGKSNVSTVNLPAVNLFAGQIYEAVYVRNSGLSAVQRLQIQESAAASAGIVL